MSADRRVDLLVAVFVGACLAVMVTRPAWQTVPFHWIWISLTLLAGFRLWPAPWTWAIVGGLAVATGAAMLLPGGPGSESLAEMSEIPLMAAVYLTMVWHSRRREHALGRVDRAIARQRDFVRDAAHGLRTPLTIARGHLELAGEALDPSPAREDVAVALDELRRLTAMSDSLLLLTTAEDPGFLSLRAVDLGAVASDVAGRWQVASGRPIGVEIQGAVVASVDEERLRCALDALLENALRATEAGGDVTVSARRDGESVVVAVRDSGCGVPESARERIFDRFYHVDMRSARRGSGLGLAVVKSVAEAHGGSLALACEADRTVFSMRLPSASPAGAQREPAAQPTAADHEPAPGPPG